MCGRQEIRFILFWKRGPNFSENAGFVWGFVFVRVAKSIFAQNLSDTIEKAKKMGLQNLKFSFVLVSELWVNLLEYIPTTELVARLTVAHCDVTVFTSRVQSESGTAPPPHPPSPRLCITVVT